MRLYTPALLGALSLTLIGCPEGGQPTDELAEESLTEEQKEELAAQVGTESSGAAGPAEAVEEVAEAPAEPALPESCSQLLADDSSLAGKDGMYVIAALPAPEDEEIDEAETLALNDAPKSMEVFCDMTTDGGGWMRVDHALAQMLNANMIAVDKAADAGIDDEGRPFTRDRKGSHTYHYSFDIPGGFAQFFTSGYKAQAWNENGKHTSETGFLQKSWDIAHNGRYRGDISFGGADQAGPIASFSSTHKKKRQGCRDCLLDFAGDGQVFELESASESFRIGWGEHGPQVEGWIPWAEGMIFVR